MEWLTNLLGFANNSGTSPFGALGGSTALTPPGGGSPNMPLPNMAGGGSPTMPLPNFNAMGNAGGAPAVPPLPPPVNVGPVPGANAGTPGPIMPNANPAMPAAPPQAFGGFQLPGIWGKMFGQGGQGGAVPAAGTAGPLGGGLSSGQNAALGQALGMLKPAQIQAPQMMNLLSGPRR